MARSRVHQDVARLADWRRIALGCAAAMFLCMALGRFSYSTMIPALVESGSVTPVAAGYIAGANLVGYLAGAIGSMWITQFFGLRHLMRAAVWIAVAALLGSAIDFGPLWLGWWRAVVGVMTGFVMVQSLSLATLHAPADRRPQAASYVFIGVGCGILFTGSAVPQLLRIGLAPTWWGIALVGIAAAALSQWALRMLPSTSRRAPVTVAAVPPTAAWYALVATSFLFSVGIVPHSIYWFDYIARVLDQGYDVAGAHWFIVGVFAILGPVFAATLARSIGIASAMMVVYFVLGIGIAAPAIGSDLIYLAASTVIFGMQPGVSTMIAARVRDLGSAAATPSMMRTTIIANGVGAAAGGVAIPAMLDATGSYAFLFWAGGFAFILGGLLCLPFLTVKCVEAEEANNPRR